MKNTAMNKHIKEFLELWWFWTPMMVFISIFFGYLYYKSHYCKEIPCIKIGTECVRSHTEDNGMTGKYHREWWICDEYREYEYESTYDSCGCNKIK